MTCVRLPPACARPLMPLVYLSVQVKQYLSVQVKVKELRAFLTDTSPLPSHTATQELGWMRHGAAAAAAEAEALQRGFVARFAAVPPETEAQQTLRGLLAGPPLDRIREAGDPPPVQARPCARLDTGLAAHVRRHTPPVSKRLPALACPRRRRAGGRGGL